LIHFYKRILAAFWSTTARTLEPIVCQVVTLKSKRKMSEMNENKLSMLISEPMEAELDMGYPTNKTKLASVSLDAGPLQRV
jgi:hypothetical protein